ncbi:hypothetical protein DEJ55_12240 [Bacillus pumilus]|nr:hypothetical protein DEJ55_12240 [Bacillus pumilus]
MKYPIPTMPRYGTRAIKRICVMGIWVEPRITHSSLYEGWVCFFISKNERCVSHERKNGEDSISRWKDQGVLCRYDCRRYCLQY